MKMTVKEFIDEYEYMCNGTEILLQTNEELQELHHQVCLMFNDNCDTIPNFELIDGGRKIRLLSEQISNEDN